MFKGNCWNIKMGQCQKRGHQAEVGNTLRCHAENKTEKNAILWARRANDPVQKQLSMVGNKGHFTKEGQEKDDNIMRQDCSSMAFMVADGTREAVNRDVWMSM